MATGTIKNSTSVDDISASARAGTNISLARIAMFKIGNIVLLYFTIGTQSSIAAGSTLISGIPAPSLICSFSVGGSNAASYRVAVTTNGKVNCEDAIPNGIYANGFITYPYNYI